MGWLKAIFTGIGSLFGFLNNKQLLDAGEDKANARQSKKVLDNVEKVKRARRNSNSDSVLDDFYSADK